MLLFVCLFVCELLAEHVILFVCELFHFVVVVRV